MGSDFSKQVCCVNCGTCKKQEVEEANEASETKPILQTWRETSMCGDRQPSTPVLKAFKQEVQSLSQDQQSPADAAEENMEICSAADPTGMTEGWEAACDSTDILVAPAGGQTEEVKILTQLDNQHGKEEVGNTEKKIKVVPQASEDLQQALQSDEQACSEGSPHAEITLQERNILDFIEIANEVAAGQGSENKPPVENGQSIIERNLPLRAVQRAEENETFLSAEHMEEMDGGKLSEISPPSTEDASIASLVEVASLLSVEAVQNTREELDPLEVIVNGIAETYSTSAVPWESLYPEGESLEPANQLLDFLEQETQPGVPKAQEMESLLCAEPAEPSEVLYQAANEDGVLGEQRDGESRGCDAGTAASEAEPQHKIMQQTIERPEEPITSVQIPVKQEAEFLTVATSLSEVLGSGGETA